jgi:hypothetical protein
LFTETIDCLQDHLQYDGTSTEEEVIKKSNDEITTTSSSSAFSPRKQQQLSFLFIENHFYLSNFLSFQENPFDILQLLHWQQKNLPKGVTNLHSSLKWRKRNFHSAFPSSNISLTVDPSPSVDPNSYVTSSLTLNPQSLVNHEWIHPMEEYTFLDISWNVGESYLFHHRELCEHVIIPLDIHLHHERLDALQRESYPRKIYNLKSRCRRCQICDVLSANYLVCDDRLLEENPCFSCR